MHTSIYDFITTQEAGFKLPVTIVENYEWNMWEHVKLTVLYKNSVYSDGRDDNKPFKNILRPILNLQYRAEGFDVKDILLFINDKVNYFKSFLVRKFHDKWARENDIDTFIDELVESYVDFGGALVKDINDKRPEVVPLQRLAFCDQTDILSGPIAERHHYSPEELKAEASRGWQNIDEVIILAQSSKTVDKTTGRQARTPGKYIEVYEVHGIFPRYWLYDTDEKGNYGGNYYDEEADEAELIRQIHICTFYQAEDGNKKGILLFKGPEKELPYKLVLRDKIYGRALGLGGAEELFEPQVWTNYGEIRMKELLDAASKIVFQTTDPAFANRNNLSNMSNLEIAVVDENKRIEQINTNPVNLPLFDNFVRQWEQQARTMGAATESILGESPSAGTPFKLQELITAESHSLHEYRKGKLATFVDEIYRDWIIPHIVKAITNGQEFLAELDLEELQEVASGVARNVASRAIKESALKGEMLNPAIIEEVKNRVKEEFLKGGNKRFVEILKGELKNAPVDVEINIVGKQKDLSRLTDKLVNVFRTIVANPTVLQNPAMAKLFNSILESSGLSPIDFSSFAVAGETPPVSAGATGPLAKLIQRPSVAERVT